MNRRKIIIDCEMSSLFDLMWVMGGAVLKFRIGLFKLTDLCCLHSVGTGELGELY